MRRKTLKGKPKYHGPFYRWLRIDNQNIKQSRLTHDNSKFVFEYPLAIGLFFSLIKAEPLSSILTHHDIVYLEYI